MLRQPAGAAARVLRGLFLQRGERLRQRLRVERRRQRRAHCFQRFTHGRELPAQIGGLRAACLGVSLCPLAVGFCALARGSVRRLLRRGGRAGVLRRTADRAGLPGRERACKDARLRVEIGAVQRAVVRQRRLCRLGRLRVFLLRGFELFLQLGAPFALLVEFGQRLASLLGRLLLLRGLLGGHGQLRLLGELLTCAFARLLRRLCLCTRLLQRCGFLLQRFARGLGLCALLVQLLVLAERVLKPRDVLQQLLHVRLLRFGGVERRPRGRLLALRLLEVRLRRFQLCACLFDRLRLAEIGEQACMLRLCLLVLCARLRPGVCVCIDQGVERCQQRVRVLCVRQRTRVVAADGLRRRTQRRDQLAACLFERRGIVLEPVLQRQILPRAEDLAEDRLALVRLGEQ